MALNIKNLTEEELNKAQENGDKKNWDIIGYLKKIAKPVGTAIVLGALIISATGCTDYNHNNMTYEQQQKFEYNQAWLQDQIDIATQEGKAIQVDKDGGLSLVQVQNQKDVGTFVFDSQETEDAFFKYHEELSKSAQIAEQQQTEQAKEQVADANASAMATQQNQEVNGGGGSNAFLWYMMGRYMSGNNSYNSMYANRAHNSFSHYSNKTFSKTYETQVAKGSKFSYDKMGKDLKKANTAKAKAGTSRAKSCSS